MDDKEKKMPSGILKAVLCGVFLICIPIVGFIILLVFIFVKLLIPSSTTENNNNNNEK